jgi:hypothetical protein
MPLFSGIIDSPQGTGARLPAALGIGRRSICSDALISSDSHSAIQERQHSVTTNPAWPFRGNAAVLNASSTYCGYSLEPMGRRNLERRSIRPDAL